MDRTRKALISRCTGDLLILWGVIWVLAFLGTQSYPRYSGWIWLGLTVTALTLVGYFLFLPYFWV